MLKKNNSWNYDIASLIKWIIIMSIESWIKEEKKMKINIVYSSISLMQTKVNYYVLSGLKNKIYFY